ncbi:hypothetical protein B7494_g1377 [Chlorociboria aeruginascens]|nr:hypothetical protein B7494_g1377 [Chlorociboria aeruginascens]
MVFNTATVGSAVTPAVVQTFISHYIDRKPRAQKPTAHISYDEGLHLIRKFLLYASHHTVEDIQRFTSQWVPHPRWVKVDEVKIPQEHLTKAAGALQDQLGHHGIERVGGKTWWQWRRPGSELKAEWIEMRADYQERKKNKDDGKRVMLYVHGGAYFFGSVDEHRYQMQRHARKLKARVFARVAGDNQMDYIPPHGFHQRPSLSWPPPNSDDMLAIEEGIVKNLAHQGKSSHPQEREADAVQGFHMNKHPEAGTQNDTAAAGPKEIPGPTANTVSGPNQDLSIMLDGNLIQIKDQIQMYASNQLISHPLVSPILQPSLGGLPPLLILTGGGEMLRDEQIYIAHKAANPTKYPPGNAFLDESPHDHNRSQINRWKPTDVQLQVWDDLCHVAPTLSFTRPAKYMYRSIAQFGAWALARAQKTEIEILDDDDVSVISQSDSDVDAAENGQDSEKKNKETIASQVGKAGNNLPAFKHHMIRQRVDRYGNIYHLEPESELIGCNLSPDEIGVIKEGPVRKWMTAKKQWDSKYASAKRRVQRKRAKEIAKGYQTFGDGEVPPPSALAGRIRTGEDMHEEKKKRSTGLSMWALWGSKHDKTTLDKEQEADREPETITATAGDGAGARPLNDTKTTQGKRMDDGALGGKSRSRSHRRIVADENQTGNNSDDIDENTPAAKLLAVRQEHGESIEGAEHLVAPVSATTHGSGASDSPVPVILIQESGHDEIDQKRPKLDGAAFPFTLKGHKTSASMTTITSQAGVSPANDMEVSGATQNGVISEAGDA